MLAKLVIARVGECVREWSNDVFFYCSISACGYGALRIAHALHRPYTTFQLPLPLSYGLPSNTTHTALSCCKFVLALQKTYFREI